MADTKTTVSVTMTLGYTNTDATRTIKIGDVARSALSSVAAKTKAVNASLAAGTDDGLADFFRADDYDASDPNNIVGKFNRIVAIKSDITEKEIYNLNEE